MQYKIAVIPGDGIGPEVTGEAVKALDAVGRRFGHQFDYEYVLAGGAAIDQAGECLPQKTIDVAKSSDAVLLGAVGGPKWDTLPGDERPEKALLRLRKELGLFANLRPAIMFDELKGACPLKEEKVEGGLDLLVVRELTRKLPAWTQPTCWKVQGFGEKPLQKSLKNIRKSLWKTFMWTTLLCNWYITLNSLTSWLPATSSEIYCQTRPV